ncbi:hypothetical protein [Formosa sp. S-31]|uniref:hypothetical protein n=1 Tax=Formosa sp. S-31 TaxID=2790949 RepID=UPI003EB6F702
MSKDELITIKGPIEKIWKFIHKSGPNKNGVYTYDSITAFTIKGNKQSFGISETKDFYYDFNKLTQATPKTTVNLTFYPKGKNIEQNVTLHIFSLSTDSETFISLKKTRQNELTGTVIFGGLMLGFIFVYAFGIKKMRTKKISEQH